MRYRTMTTSGVGGSHIEAYSDEEAVTLAEDQHGYEVLQVTEDDVGLLLVVA